MCGWMNERDDKKLIAVCGSHNFFWVIHIYYYFTRNFVQTQQERDYNLSVYTMHSNSSFSMESQRLKTSLGRCIDVTVLS